MTRSDDRTRGGDEQSKERERQRPKLPYEAPRILTDEAFEQISLLCDTKHGTHKNFT